MQILPIKQNMVIETIEAVEELALERPQTGLQLELLLKKYFKKKEYQ